MRYIYELINIGKGTYGSGNLQITPQNLLLIYEGECENTPPSEECCIDILDSGSLMPRRDALDFVRMIVEDDEPENKTVVTAKTVTFVGELPPMSGSLEGDEWINNTNWKRYKFYDGYWVEVYRGHNQLNVITDSPIDGSYGDQSSMIADQENQTQGFLYYDGTGYWEYMGTTNGDISDYRPFSSPTAQPTSFIELTDTENSYLGQAGKVPVVNDLENGLEFRTLSVQVPDGIVTYGSATLSGNDITYNSAWEWRVSDVTYTPTTSTIISFPAAATGFVRIDLVVGNTSGQIIRIPGTEVVDGDPVFAPTPPVNTVSLQEVTVFETGISGFTNFALSSFVRYDINSQGLTAPQRLNARTNIQAVSKDTNDTRTGTLTNTGTVTIEQGSFIVNNTTGGSGLLSNNPYIALRNNLNDIILFRRGIFTTGGFNRTNRSEFEIMRDFYVRGTQYFFLNSGNAIDIRTENTDEVRITLSSTGRIFHSRSGAASESVTRDELPFNYIQTVTTSGVLNDLSVNDDTKLLILTQATQLTGIVPVTVNPARMMRIYANGTNVLIKNNDINSLVAHRFQIGSDFLIPNGSYADFIYINSAWRMSVSSSSASSDESVERTGSEIKFDVNSIHGNSGFITGNITFDFTDAKLGKTCSMLHRSATIPTIPVNGVIISGMYEVNVDNYMWFHLRRKTPGSEVVEITIGQRVI